MSSPELVVGHPHSHAAPPPVPVLDIGGDVGALVVVLHDEHLPVGGELFACPEGRPAEHFHTGVHHRDLGGLVAHVAIFPEIVEGSYELLDDAREPTSSFRIVGGEVTQLDMR